MVLAWVRSGRDRATAAWDRVQAARADSPTLDTAFVVVDRDAAAAGSLLAGALAYRLFLWLLPAALVAYAGLGFAASSGSAAAADAAHAAGLRQFTAASIEQAATDAHRSRWAALIIGAVLLYTASGHLLKGFTAMSALAWHESRRRTRPIHTLAVVGFGLVVAGLAAGGAALRHHGALGLLALLLGVARAEIRGRGAGLRAGLLGVRDVQGRTDRGACVVRGRRNVDVLERPAFLDQVVGRAVERDAAGQAEVTGWVQVVQVRG